MQAKVRAKSVRTKRVFVQSKLAFGKLHASERDATSRPADDVAWHPPAKRSESRPVKKKTDDALSAAPTPETAASEGGFPSSVDVPMRTRGRDAASPRVRIRRADRVRSFRVPQPEDTVSRAERSASARVGEPKRDRSRFKPGRNRVFHFAQPDATPVSVPSPASDTQFVVAIQAAKPVRVSPAHAKQILSGPVDGAVAAPSRLRVLEEAADRAAAPSPRSTSPKRPPRGAMDAFVRTAPLPSVAPKAPPCTRVVPAIPEDVRRDAAEADAAELRGEDGEAFDVDPTLRKKVKRKQIKGRPDEGREVIAGIPVASIVEAPPFRERVTELAAHARERLPEMRKTSGTVNVNVKTVYRRVRGYPFSFGRREMLEMLCYVFELYRVAYVQNLTAEKQEERNDVHSNAQSYSMRMVDLVNLFGLLFGPDDRARATFTAKADTLAGTEEVALDVAAPAVRLLAANPHVAHLGLTVAVCCEHADEGINITVSSGLHKAGALCGVLVSRLLDRCYGWLAAARGENFDMGVARAVQRAKRSGKGAVPVLEEGDACDLGRALAAVREADPNAVRAAPVAVAAAPASLHIISTELVVRSEHFYLGLSGSGLRYFKRIIHNPHLELDQFGRVSTVLYGHDMSRTELNAPGSFGIFFTFPLTEEAHMSSEVHNPFADAGDMKGVPTLCTVKMYGSVIDNCLQLTFPGRPSQLFVYKSIRYLKGLAEIIGRMPWWLTDALAKREDERGADVKNVRNGLAEFIH